VSLTEEFCRCGQLSKYREHERIAKADYEVVNQRCGRDLLSEWIFRVRDPKSAPDVRRGTLPWLRLEWTHRDCSVSAAGGIVPRMLKAIGFWIRDLRDESYPAPQELVGALPEEQRRSLTHYLESGATFEQYFGYAWCRFVC